MSIILEEQLRILSKSINGLVDQLKKSESLNVDNKKAAEILGYASSRADESMKIHRDNGDIKLWKGSGPGCTYLYDKAEILELRMKIFTEHKLKAV